MFQNTGNQKQVHEFGEPQKRLNLTEYR